MPRLGSTVARLKLKGIDGGSHKRWSIWVNSIQREEPYLGLTCSWYGPERARTGETRSEHRCCMAVVSSCREMLWLSPVTSETLVPSCQRVMPGTLGRLPVPNRRKVGMTSSHHGPYVQGATGTTMAGTKGSKTARWSKSLKLAPVRIGGCNPPP